jgi:hypothetical protein
LIEEVDEVDLAVFEDEEDGVFGFADDDVF